MSENETDTETECFWCETVYDKSYYPAACPHCAVAASKVFTKAPLSTDD